MNFSTAPIAFVDSAELLKNGSRIYFDNRVSYFMTIGVGCLSSHHYYGDKFLFGCPSIINRSIGKSSVTSSRRMKVMKMVKLAYQEIRSVPCKYHPIGM